MSTPKRLTPSPLLTALPWRTILAYAAYAVPSQGAAPLTVDYSRNGIR